MFNARAYFVRGKTVLLHKGVSLNAYIPKRNFYLASIPLLGNPDIIQCMTKKHCILIAFIFFFKP
jgi:hypothetical protein